MVQEGGHAVTVFTVGRDHRPSCLPPSFYGGNAQQSFLRTEVAACVVSYLGRWSSEARGCVGPGPLSCGWVAVDVAVGVQCDQVVAGCGGWGGQPAVAWDEQGALAVEGVH